MKKYIFLDFDGVLNTENYQAQLRADGKPGWADYGMLFDPAAVANLKRILDAVPEVRIVVESSWKVRGLDELRLMWAERGLPGTLYDVTPTIFCEELLTVDLSDPDSIRKVEGLAKGKEIRAWLRRHAGQTTNMLSLTIGQTSTGSYSNIPFMSILGWASPNPMRRRSSCA